MNEKNIKPSININEFNADLKKDKSENNESFNFSEKDYKKLKNSKYFEIKDKYKTAFIIKNKKTGAIAEIRAASEIHACSIIGWRIKNTKFIDAVKVE